MNNVEMQDQTPILPPEEARRRKIRILLAGSVFPKRGGAIATNKKRILDVQAALGPNLMGARILRGIRLLMSISTSLGKVDHARALCDRIYQAESPIKVVIHVEKYFINRVDVVVRPLFNGRRQSIISHNHAGGKYWLAGIHPVFIK